MRIVIRDRIRQTQGSPDRFMRLFPHSITKIVIFFLNLITLVESLGSIKCIRYLHLISISYIKIQTFIICRYCIGSKLISLIVLIVIWSFIEVNQYIWRDNIWVFWSLQTLHNLLAIISSSCPDILWISHIKYHNRVFLGTNLLCCTNQVINHLHQPVMLWLNILNLCFTTELDHVTIHNCELSLILSSKSQVASMNPFYIGSILLPIVTCSCEMNMAILRIIYRYSSYQDIILIIETKQLICRLLRLWIVNDVINSHSISETYLDNAIRCLLNCKIFISIYNTLRQCCTTSIKCHNICCRCPVSIDSSISCFIPRLYTIHILIIVLCTTIVLTYRLCILLILVAVIALELIARLCRSSLSRRQ